MRVQMSASAHGILSPTDPAIIFCEKKRQQLQHALSLKSTPHAPYPLDNSIVHIEFELFLLFPVWSRFLFLNPEQGTRNSLLPPPVSLQSSCSQNGLLREYVLSPIRSTLFPSSYCSVLTPFLSSSLTVEHNTLSEQQQQQNTTTTRPRRPDLSTFFATLSEISPRPAESRTRIHAVPVPADVSAAFRSLAEAFDVMRRNLEVGGGQNGDGQGEGEGLLSEMITALLREAETPPREVEGVSEEFCDGTYSIHLNHPNPTQPLFPFSVF